MYKRIKYFLSPSFIEKQSILKSIEYLIRKYEKNLRDRKLLDIGCGSQPYRSLFESLNIDYKGIDFKRFSYNLSFKTKQPDFYFEENYKDNFLLSQFKNNSYDILVAFQVLEHHQRPEIFFAEAARILKKSGILIISFPFIWELHEEPNDFQRLTHYKIQKLCDDNNLKMVEQIKRGGLLSTNSQLVNLSLVNANMPKVIKVVLYLLFLLPFQYFAYIYDSLFSKPQRKIFLGYTFLLQKE